MIHMRRTRERLGLTLSDLAERTGIDPSMLSRYERGAMDPSATKAVLVARALGVSLESLVSAHGRNADTPEAPCVLPPNDQVPLASSAGESASGTR